MVQLVTSTFGGMRPMLSDYRLGMESAVEAVDCEFMSGAIRPLRRSRFIRSFDGSVGGIVPQDMDRGVYRTADAPGSWVDTGERTIYTAGDGPRWFDNADPSKDYRFGRMPDLFERWMDGSDAVEPILVRTGPVPQAEDPSYFYAVAVANTETGDESGLSAASDIQAGAANSVAVEIESDQIDSLRDLLDDEDIDNMEVRVYRSLTGDYLLIGRVPLPKAGQRLSFTDQISEIEDDAPIRFRWPLESAELPEDARGMIQHPNGFLLCHDDDTVYMSDPLDYSKFPASLQIRFRAERVVAIKEFLNRVLIFFDNAPHRILQLDLPGEGQRLISPESAYACVSGQSVAKIASGILYAGQEGIYVTDGYKSTLIAEDLFDSVSFRPFIPETVRIYGGDHEFLMVSETRGSFLFRRDLQMTKLSEDVLSAFWHRGAWWILEETAAGSKLAKGFAGNEPRNMVWEGGLNTLPQPGSMRTVFVYGDYEDRTPDILQGGLGTKILGLFPLGQSPSQRATVTTRRQIMFTLKMDEASYTLKRPIRSSRPTAMPAGSFRQARAYGFRIEGNAEVRQIAVAGRGRTLARVPYPS